MKKHLSPIPAPGLDENTLENIEVVDPEIVEEDTNQ